MTNVYNSRAHDKISDLNDYDPRRIHACNSLNSGVSKDISNTYTVDFSNFRFFSPSVFCNTFHLNLYSAVLSRIDQKSFIKRWY